MSVIENAIKRLQAARGSPPPVRETPFDALATDGGAARRAAVSEPAVAPCVVPLAEATLRAAGLLPPPHQEREIAQQYRQIKRPVINRALGRGMAAAPHGNLVMIASAMAGEGKTFTSLNLALSLRLEEDLTVLLVDGDVVNPRMSQVLGVEAAPGLLDLVRDPGIEIRSLVLPTDVPGLAFLPAGRPSENATELLASARMQQVVSQLAAEDRTRLVIFDSAPLLLTTESQALAQVAGQILLVVRAGHTPQQIVLEAVETLAEETPLALVLNQCVRPSHGYYYPYGGASATRERPAES